MRQVAFIRPCLRKLCRYVTNKNLSIHLYTNRNRLFPLSDLGYNYKWAIMSTTRTQSIIFLYRLRHWILNTLMHMGPFFRVLLEGVTLILIFFLRASATKSFWEVNNLHIWVAYGIFWGMDKNRSIILGLKVTTSNVYTRKWVLMKVRTVHGEQSFGSDLRRSGTKKNVFVVSTN